VFDRPANPLGAPLPFASYDRRNYPTHSVVDGYARWAPIYNTVDDRLDLVVLDALADLPARVAGARVVDLGCGTGRVGAWLAAHGVREVVGVDLSEAMLAGARARDVYAATSCASILATGLPSASFDGAVSNMVVDHVADLDGFFAEAHRLVRPGGWLAVVDYHPFFLMRGIPTHFSDAAGHVAIENYVHASSEFFQRAVARGFAVVSFIERFVDEEWVRAVPGYAKHVGFPVSHGWLYARL
jgi:SAM-dependent methyltransferase